jgi:hypothetical protein
MPLTQVQSGLLESGAALNNIGAGNITPAFLNTQAQYTGFKNRLINGDMVIDQRNNGAAVTFPSGGNNLYTVDRWQGFKQIATGGSFTIARSSVAPAGFTNSALVTITSAATDTGTSVNALTQFIEGLNVSDLGWGTANAQSITLSFWVRSSLTGTYSCSLNNDGYNYSYVANYTITAANTWEQKSVTIPGPTAGTWLTTNGAGIRVWFDLGTGTGRNGTGNTWLASEAYRTAGSVQLLANNGATFYITGVQLEKGQTATSFDVLPYTTELQLCQRYCIVYTQEVDFCRIAPGVSFSSTTAVYQTAFPVEMRAIPTVTTTDLSQFRDVFPARVASPSALVWSEGSRKTMGFNTTNTSFTAGQAGWFSTNNASARMTFSAEL